MTIKQRFANFTKNIKPTPAHLEAATAQATYMIEQLHDKVSADGAFELHKILLAGSNAKHTSLLRTAENEFDIDLGAYYIGAGASKSQLDTLLEFTKKRLIEIYPNKDESDFTVLSSAVRVQFIGGIRLCVDVAPIIKDDSLGIVNGGWIPRPDGWRLSSVTAHNEFVSSRTVDSRKRIGPVHFNRLVRLIKWWNNRLPDELKQPAIFSELVVAAAVASVEGVTDQWQTSLRNVFLYLRKDRFATPIVFADSYEPAKITLPNDTVVALDSVNPDNNVASQWTKATRDAYLAEVEEAYRNAAEARSAEQDGEEDAAVDAWCAVFGGAFRSLSEEKVPA